MFIMNSSAKKKKKKKSLTDERNKRHLDDRWRVTLNLPNSSPRSTCAKINETMIQKGSFQLHHRGHAEKASSNKSSMFN